MQMTFFLISTTFDQVLIMHHTKKEQGNDFETKATQVHFTKVKVTQNRNLLCEKTFI